MECRSSQVLVLSVNVTHGSKDLFFAVWQHRGWLTVPDKGLSNKRVFLDMSFLIDEIPGLQGMMFKVFVSGEYTVERLFY